MYYHVWFVTKYRRPVLNGAIETIVNGIFAECIQRHLYHVLELATNKDHVHILLEAANKKELSAVVRTLKAVSAKELHTTPRFRVGNINIRYYRRKPVVKPRAFWARKFGYRQVKKYEIWNVRKYIRTQ